MMETAKSMGVKDIAGLAIGNVVAISGNSLVHLSEQRALIVSKR